MKLSETKTGYVFMPTITLGILLITGSGCSSTPTASIYNEDSAAMQQVRALEQRINADRTQQIDVLAPKNFSNAEAKLAEAHKKMSKNEDSKDIMITIGDSRTSLDIAEARAQKTRPLIPDLLGTRSEGIQADAPHLAGKAWENAEDRLKNLMEGQEKNQNPSVSEKERKDIQEQYIKAQTDALKVHYLAQTKGSLKSVEDDKGEKLVPSAYQEAKNKVAAAEGVIDGNRNNPETIKVASDNAQASVAHARDLLDRAKTVKTGSPEQVASDLLSKDVRNQSLNRDLNATETSLAQTEMERQALNKKNETQKYIASLQKRFDPNQAEVSQQGSSVLIRLKGLKFKSGNTDIPSQSVTLLEEVKSTIKENPESSVMVEGHTDAIGGATQNQKLSQKRAESIKDYLAKDSVVPNEKFVAKGYGFEKPITSNKTKEGRAQNRRVDILIENIESHPQQ